MPLFGRSDDRDAERRRDEQQRSIEALTAGGLPLHAQERLDRARQSGAFTSDLSVDEFLLARQSGFRPISQVMGSSIYHVGWQSLPYSTFRQQAQSRELEVVSMAFNHSRRLALSRMQEEARRVGAHAVVGVHLRRQERQWSAHIVEFNAVGTAVALPDTAPPEQPSLTNLSGQDFWKLFRAGFWPLGLVGWSTVYYVVSWWRWHTRRTWTGYPNTEITDFSQGIQHARRIVMNAMGEQALQLGAQGIVEVRLDREEHEMPRDDNSTRDDMMIKLHGLGTAIAELPEHAAPPIHPVLRL
jgi:uncharacterized protein YbjQ (UPF0145 family)